MPPSSSLNLNSDIRDFKLDFSLLMYPVLSIIEHWRMNCGADWRKVWKNPETRTSLSILATRAEFTGRLASISKIPIKYLKLLKTEKNIY